MFLSFSAAVKCIKSNDNVFIHSAAAAPKKLIFAMTKRFKELKNVSIYSLHTEGSAPYAAKEMENSFRVKPFFIGENIRENIQAKRGSYIPVSLSEAPALFRDGIIPLDIALISVSPPDEHGFCSLGSSVDISLAAVQTSKIVIAQINRFVPRTNGDGFIHISKIHFITEGHEPLPETEQRVITKIEKKIGQNVSKLIENGATLQLGIGAIPNAVLACLTKHKNLGIHSEMFSDGIIPLVDSGVINGANKTEHRHSIVGSFVIGTQKLFDFIHENPMVKLLDFSYVNNIDSIRKNPKFTAINSAIEIDLTGQICADSIGSKMYSGVGGQVDFIRGAALSEGGKPIIALSSTTKNGESKIVPFLKKGAGVVTTRADVYWVVTEYGSVNLHGKTLFERAKLLTSIAHPSHRDALLNSISDF
jgi:4-hydroxybutyrate CoA-transferase